MTQSNTDDSTQPPAGQSAQPGQGPAGQGSAGQGDYVVQQGECITSIAFDHGFFWQTIWNHPANAALKQARKNPNVLLPGDLLTIPPLQERQESASTGNRHQYQVMGTPQILKLRLLDALNNPRASLQYSLQIDGAIVQGTTDADGRLEHPIPPNAREGKLVIGKDGGQEIIPLALGHLDPITEISGVQMRLQNLGHDCGAIDGDFGPRSQAALKRFQRGAKLPETGQLDQTTRDALQKRHGS